MPPKPPAHRPPAERREAREAWQLMVTVPGITQYEEIEMQRVHGRHCRQHVFGLVLVVVICPGCAAISRQEQGVDREARDVLVAAATLRYGQGGEPLLHLELRYNGEKELAIPNSDLPWRHVWGLGLAAIRADGMWPVEPSYPLLSPPGGSVALRPGALLEGSFDLRRRFRNLTDMLKHHDVVLFWTLQLRPLDEDPLPRVGGWLVIPSRQGAPGQSGAGMPNSAKE